MYFCVHTMGSIVLQGQKGSIVLQNLQNHGLKDKFSHPSSQHRQRRMGVEPTRDRAERPLSRFEDGETHRGPYTSMFRTTEQTRNMAYCAIGYTTCQDSVCTRFTSTSSSVFTMSSALRRPGRSRLPATAMQRIPAAWAASTPATASSMTREREGSICNCWAAFRKMSGAGLP